MEYFFYCRDRPDTGALRERLGEEHWSFMDRYAEAMIARGPTLESDGTATGSMHIVDLPDVEAAYVFAYEEPYFKAGVFGDVFMRRWRNALGGTMWDFKGAGGGRFLIIGHGKTGLTATRDALLPAQGRFFDDQRYLPHFIVRGPLLSDGGGEWVGSAMLVEFPDRTAVESMLASAPFVRAGLYESVEIHDWRFGGRS